MQEKWLRNHIGSYFIIVIFNDYLCVTNKWLSVIYVYNIKIT